MEEKNLAVLRRFASVSYFTLCGETLAGQYSFASERQFKIALENLQRSGKAVSFNGVYGNWMLGSVPGDGDRKSRGRIRATK